MSLSTPPQTALVTGATGYLASWIVKYLLEAGWTVHATVRSLAQMEKTAHLTAMAAQAPNRLHLFEADLLAPNSYTQAMAGCQVVIHTASPFITGKVRDPQAQLIDPAVKGVRNVLDAATATPGVQRVVLTSSVVAIYTDASDLAGTEKGVFDESHWNTTASLSYQPYSYSKTLAEKTAWEMAQTQNRWNLVVINPGFILGPSLTRRNDSVSIDFMIKMGDGTYLAGMPNLELAVVDVRDAAHAHIAAASQPAASGRHILAREATSMLSAARLLRAHFGKQYPFPTRKTPKWLAWLVGPLFGLSRRYVSRHIGKSLHIDNRYGIKDLGIEYRPLEETLVQHFQQLLDDGLVRRR